MKKKIIPMNREKNALGDKTCAKDGTASIISSVNFWKVLGGSMAQNGLSKVVDAIFFLGACTCGERVWEGTKD